MLNQGLMTCTLCVIPTIEWMAKEKRGLHTKNLHAS